MDNQAEGTYSKTDSIFSKFLESMFITYDTAVPRIKKWVKIMLGMLFAMLLAIIIFVAIGIGSGNNELVTIGCIVKTIASAAGIILLLPILIIVESVGKGKITGRGSIRFLTTCVFTQLVIAILILWSPMEIGLKTFFTFNVASFMLATTFALENTAARTIPGIVLAFAIATLFFPTWSDRLFGGIERFNEPRLIPVNQGGISEGKIPFFVKGKPAVWYFLTPEGQYELFDHSGKHDIYGTELRPITAEIVRKLMKSEGLISPRNLAYLGNASLKSAPTPNPPSPAPEPYQHPPSYMPEPPPPPIQPAYQPPAYSPEPAPQYEFATFFVENNRPNAGLSREIASWFGSGAISGAEIVPNSMFTYQGEIFQSDRQKLAGTAEKLIIATCSLQRSYNSRNWCYVYSIHAKVFNARTGSIIRTIDKPSAGTAEGFSEQSARNSAISLALSILKDELR